MRPISGWILALLPGLAAGALTLPNGAQYNPSITSDGRFLVLETTASNLSSGDLSAVSYDLYIYDRVTRGIVKLAKNGNLTFFGSQQQAEISGDGEWIAFSSSITALVGCVAGPCWDTNNAQDVFVVRGAGLLTNSYHTAPGHGIVLVSKSSDGVLGNLLSGSPDLSTNGRHVVFLSAANNLVAGDTNNNYDIFVHDRDANTNGIFDEVAATGGVRTVLVSRNDLGHQTADLVLFPRISGNGRVVCFNTSGRLITNLDFNATSDVYVYDRDADGNGVFDEPGGTHLTVGSANTGSSAANGDCFDGHLNADGTRLSFARGGTANTTVYWRDLVSLITTAASKQVSGATAASCAGGPISGDGSLIVFSSFHTNLVVGDVNAQLDVFVHNHGVLPHTTEMVSRRTDGGLGNNWSGGNGLNDTSLALSDNGRFVVFESIASNLLPGDTNGVRDLFIWDRQTATLDAFRPDLAPPGWSPGSASAQPGSYSAQLAWPPATDEVAIAFYEVNRNGSLALTVGGGITNVVLGGLQPGTLYSCQVVAVDVAFNSSTGGNPWASFTTLAAPADTDGDGLPDAWELAYFGHVTGATASADSDGDTVDNRSEYLADTHPLLTASVFRVSGWAPPTLQVQFTSSTGRVYTLEYATDIRWPVAWTGTAVAWPGIGATLALPAPNAGDAAGIRITAQPR